MRKPNFAQISRLMTPGRKLFTRLPHYYKLFDFDAEKIGAYLRTEKHFLNDREKSTCYYGPMLDGNNNILATKRKDGNFTVHHMLHWQFT